jgi:hypothetical protein
MIMIMHAHCVYDAMMLRVHDQMMIDMFSEASTATTTTFFIYCCVFLSSCISKVNILSSIRTKREMMRTRDSATSSPEHGPIFEEPEPTSNKSNYILKALTIHIVLFDAKKAYRFL